MCTAIRFNDRLFGRTFDYERSFGEMMYVLPRSRAKICSCENRYAIMGVGVLGSGRPMFFDGVNEYGLCAAALNFPHYAVYHKGNGILRSIPSGDLIGYALGQCKSVKETKALFSDIVIADTSDAEGSSPLHWIFADRNEAVTVESVAEGLLVVTNPIGVMTNSPGLKYHLTRLGDFAAVDRSNPDVGMCDSLIYSRGMGGIGLPGDFSSSSRFIRAAFLRESVDLSVSEGSYADVSLAMAVMSNLSIPKGAVLADNSSEVYTRYAAVIDLDEPGYYLSTADCRAIGHIRLSDSMCDGAGPEGMAIYHKEYIFDL